jgi:putative flippase GtrA
MNVSALPLVGDDPGPGRPLAVSGPADTGPDDRPHPVVEVVVPVYNEAHVLEASIRTLHGYLADHLLWAWRITIADNASTDGTFVVARRLATELPQVRAVHLDRKGRGLALKTVWAQSDADVVAYMDVDLSTDLDALLPLVAPLVSGHSDLATGSRLDGRSRVVRGPRRELISRCYNTLLHVVLHMRVRDAQCGFKAGRRTTIQALLPAVQDNGWFFDTELLVAAERAGLRIHEVPVDWVDDPDSRVDVWRTALDDLKGVWRVLRHRRVPEIGGRPDLPEGMAGQLPPFASIGVVCTLLYVIGFNGLRGPLGAGPANVVALTATMVLNTAANRRFTFGRRGRQDRTRHYVEAGAVWLVGLLASSLALGVVAVLVDQPGALLQTVALLAAGAVATVVRFVGLRSWVFHPERAAR